MYQILLQSVRFCRLYIKKHFGVFFSVHNNYIMYIRSLAVAVHYLETLCQKSGGWLALCSGENL